MHATVWVWVFVLLAADLKVSVHPQIHWVITACAFFLLLPAFFSLRLSSGWSIQVHPIWFVIIFIMAVIATSMAGEDSVYGSLQAFKLGVILLLAFPFLLVSPQFSHAGFSAAQAAVWINLGLLGLGVLISPVFASQMASDGRWGTFFNYPGSLWRVGILVLVFAAYVLLRKNGFVYHFGLLVASLLLIYLDSSRTGTFLVTTALVYLGFILLIESKRSVIVRVALVSLFLLGGALLGWAFVSEEGALSHVLSQRVVDTVEVIKTGDFESADITRYQMIQTAIREIENHPFFGGGVGTTRFDILGDPMVVHNTYLQIWADIGLLGFLAYTVLVWGWVVWVPRFFMWVRQQPDCRLRGIYYNSVFLLFSFAFSGFFHPLSTEWSEWIAFMIPYALYMEGVRSSLRGKQLWGKQVLA